jgi:hypothetical protein
MGEITRILNAIEQGDPHAAWQLLPLAYDELRRLAAGRGEGKSGQALLATAPRRKKNLPRPHNALPLYALI